MFSSMIVICTLNLPWKTTIFYDRHKSDLESQEIFKYVSPTHNIILNSILKPPLNLPG